MSDDNTNESKLDALLEGWKGNGAESGMKDMVARMDKLESDNKALLAKAEDIEKANKETADAAAYEKDIGPVVKTLKGEVNATPEFAERWLHDVAQKDKKLTKAWDNYSEDPEVFDKLIEALIPKFKEDAEKEALSILNLKPEDLPTEDPEDKKETKAEQDARKTSHAVRIARNQNEPVGDGYENINWASLSDSEFAVKSHEVFADMESGKLKPVKSA